MKKLFILFTTILSVGTYAQTNKENIRRAVKDHLKEVKDCYEDSLKQKTQKPDLEGTVIVDFEVDDIGSVKNAKINTSKSSLKDEKVHRCITDKISTWKFPAAPKGLVVSISYPFRFQKASK